MSLFGTTAKATPTVTTRPEPSLPKPTTTGPVAADPAVIAATADVNDAARRRAQAEAALRACRAILNPLSNAPSPSTHAFRRAQLDAPVLERASLAAELEVHERAAVLRDATQAARNAPAARRPGPRRRTAARPLRPAGRGGGGEPRAAVCPAHTPLDDVPIARAQSPRE